MFLIRKLHEDGFEKIILQDSETNTYAAIVPANGAILHAFVANRNGEHFNIIESYSSAEDFKNHVESKGFRGCKLSPFVCRLNKGTYHFAENKYTVEKFYLGESAIHGLLYDKIFTLVSETANELHASVTMKYEYRQDDPGYPFNYDCIITWQLESNNKLAVTTECINKDEGLIPMQDGWHPYFNLGSDVDDLQIEFQSREMVEFNSDLLPTQNLIPYEEFNSLKKIGDTFFDNCFTLDLETCQPLCVLRNSSKKIELEIYPGLSYPYLQIYIPPDRKKIAIENLSGAPDGFNNEMGVVTLEPKQSVLFTTAYKIKFLE
jgi:aldose 1-epimerase